MTGPNIIFPLFYIFIYFFWWHWLFVAACGLSLVATRGLLCCGAQASHRSGFSCCGAWAPGCTGFRSCASWARLLRAMWDLCSLTRDWARVPCVGRWLPNQWTTREVSSFISVSSQSIWQFHLSVRDPPSVCSKGCQCHPCLCRLKLGSVGNSIWNL